MPAPVAWGVIPAVGRVLYGWITDLADTTGLVPVAECNRQPTMQLKQGPERWSTPPTSSSKYCFDLIHLRSNWASRVRTPTLPSRNLSVLIEKLNKYRTLMKIWTIRMSISLQLDQLLKSWFFLYFFLYLVSSDDWCTHLERHELNFPIQKSSSVSNHLVYNWKLLLSLLSALLILESDGD